MVARRYNIKLADIGGDGNKQSFEQAMARIAHTYIQDNAPSLMQYEQGFQLIEKKDDDSQAVGVLGFNVNQMQVYCPVFFLNGELKGNELMYLADQDLFVPVKEAWLNKIMGRKPIIIGEGIDKYTHRQGYQQPDLSIFKDSPIKTSSANYADWLLPALPTFIHIRGNSIKKAAHNAALYGNRVRDGLRLSYYVKRASANNIYNLKEAIKESPIIQKAYESIYGPVSYLDKMYETKRVKESSAKLIQESMERKYMPDGTPADSVTDTASWIHKYVNNSFYKNASYVSIISYTATIENGSPIPLTESEKETMANKGYVVLDSRKDNEVSQVIERSNSSLQNPGKNGLYEVLMPDGTLEKRLIVFPRSGVYDDDTQPTNIVWVINPNTGDTLTHVETSKIWCSSGIPEKPTSVMDKVGIDLDMNSEYVFYKDGVYFGPIFVETSLPNMGGLRRRSACSARSGGEIDSVLIGTAPGSTLHMSSKELQIPKDAYCIKLNTNYTDDDIQSELGDIHLLKIATAGITEDVKLTVSGDTCYINGAPQESAFTGLCSLIKNYGLREKSAEKLMTKAANDFTHGHTVKFTIKRAESPSLDPRSQFTFPDAQENVLGGLLGSPMPTAPDSTQQLTEYTDAYGVNTGPYENTLDPTFPQQESQQIMQAINNGQQEVFDVSMLKQLLRNVNLEDKLDEISTKLIRAMDSLGRLLFLFYWKGDEFKELYGTQDLQELEGGLRKAFETVGDIILFLQKTDNAQLSYKGESAIDLSEIDD